MKTTIGGIDVGNWQVRSALKYSLLDACFWQIMFVMIENFSVAAALSLKAPSIAISLLGPLPLFIGAFAQMFALRCVNPNSPRKSYIVIGTKIQTACIILAAVAGFMPRPASIVIFITAYALYVISGKLFDNLWQTWFSDLVPTGIMGRHMAWRNTILSSLGLFASLVVGIIARKYTNDNSPWLFFCTIFTIAALARVGSTAMLVKQYEPPKTTPLKPFSFKNITLPKSLIMFTAAMAFFNGAATMSGPFFGVWALRDLKFTYLTLTIASASTSIGALLTVRFWGKLSDRIGAAKVLMICGFAAAIVPLPFIFFHEAWQICTMNFYSGVAWVGFGNAAFTYLLQKVDSERPEQTLSTYNCIQGVSSLGFGFLGGILATRLPTIFGWKLQSLFLLSGVLRLIVWAFLILKIHDTTGRIGIRSTVSQKINEIWERLPFRQN